MEYPREPCPWRVVDDYGGAFSMGSICGSIFQGINGHRNAPSGFRRRLFGGLTAIKTRAPQIAGNFGIWGGLFSAIECALIYYREKDDPWNSIISGAFTGGVLSSRAGLSSMLGSAAVGGVILALIEGVSIIVTRMQAENFAKHMTMYEVEDPEQLEHLKTRKKYFFSEDSYPDGVPSKSQFEARNKG